MWVFSSVSAERSCSSGLGWQEVGTVLGFRGAGESPAGIVSVSVPRSRVKTIPLSQLGRSEPSASCPWWRVLGTPEIPLERVFLYTSEVVLTQTPVLGQKPV